MSTKYSTILSIPRYFDDFGRKDRLFNKNITGFVEKVITVDLTETDKANASNIVNNIFQISIVQLLGYSPFRLIIRAEVHI